MCVYAAAYVHSFCLLYCVARHVDTQPCLATHYKQNEWPYAAAYPHMKTHILTSDLTRIKKLVDDDHLMIETCWSDFKCFNVWHLN
jgi:hypothetical protein